MRKFRKRHETIADGSETQQNLSKEMPSVTSKTDLTQEEIDELKKTAKKIPLKQGSSLEEDFQFLLSASKKWKNYFIEFPNGKKIYSCEIKTEDDIYLQYFWKTKTAHEREVWERERNYEIKKKEKELEALNKIPQRIEEWKQYIDEDKRESWERYVNSSARDMYNWMDIDYTLQLLKMIKDWESWESIQKAFNDQDNSFFSYGIVRNWVVYFSNKGDEADKNLKK